MIRNATSASIWQGSTTCSAVYRCVRCGAWCYSCWCWRRADFPSGKTTENCAQRLLFLLRLQLLFCLRRLLLRLLRLPLQLLLSFLHCGPEAFCFVVISRSISFRGNCASVIFLRCYVCFHHPVVEDIKRGGEIPRPQRSCGGNGTF